MDTEGCCTKLLCAIRDCEQSRLTAQMSGFETGWEHPSTQAMWQRVVTLTSELKTRPAAAGISVWLPRNDRPDRFKSKDHVVFHFPCCSCKHASTTENEFCQGCAHYAKGDEE